MAYEMVFVLAVEKVALLAAMLVVLKVASKVAKWVSLLVVVMDCYLEQRKVASMADMTVAKEMKLDLEMVVVMVLRKAVYLAALMDLHLAALMALQKVVHLAA